MRIGVGFALLVSSLFLATPARAATVSVEGGVLRYAASAGEINLVDVTHDPDYDTMEGPTIWILEYSADLTAGPGCVPAPNVWGARMGAACAGAVSVALELGDGDDAAYGVLVESMAADGGAGNDILWSSVGDDVLAGGDGDDRILGDVGRDRILGGDGNDTLDGDNGEPGGPSPTWRPLDGTRVVGDPDELDGGAGDDVVLGDGGADLIRGGPGSDLADYSGRYAAVRITLGHGADDGEAGEGDNLLDVERVRASRFADDVTGSAADEELQLGPGNDRADGGGGRDRIRAGDGNDRVEARDGFVDTLLCGPGSDHGRVDAQDEATGDCDLLDRPVAPTRYSGVLEVRARRAPRGVLRISGRLRLERAHFGACPGNQVGIRVIASGAASAAQLPLDARCRYAGRLRLPVHGPGRVQVLAELPDSTSLVAARADTVVTGRQR